MGADKSAENTPKNLSTMYKFSFEHGNFFGKRIKENKLNKGELMYWWKDNQKRKLVLRGVKLRKQLLPKSSIVLQNEKLTLLTVEWSMEPNFLNGFD